MAAAPVSISPIATPSTTPWRAVLFTVDTNLLVYAADADSPDHRAARQLLEGWRSGRELWYVGWNILYEFARVVTHPRVMRRPWTFPQAWRFCQTLLDSPPVRLMDESPAHAQCVESVASTVPGIAGNLVHDLHTVALMTEHGLRVIYTCDADLNRFPGIQAINPLNHPA